MRKISKLSLVAAVAVAGFSTANAQPLEEAIKNVETSGSVVYRYDNFNDSLQGGLGSSENNQYKIGLNLSSKVNDYVKFNSRFLVSGADGGFVNLDAHDGDDANADVLLSHANFAFTGIKNTTITAGKQGLATPWTVAIDSDGNEQTGTGILALSTVGPVTAGAGYFNQTNLDKSGNINGTRTGSTLLGQRDVTGLNTIIHGVPPFVPSVVAGNDQSMGSRDIYVGALLADLSPVKLEAWYLDMADIFDTYTLVASADFALSSDSKVGVEARYVSLTLDDTIARAAVVDKDNEMYRLQVTGNVGIVNAKVGYTATGKDGGLTALDQDAQNATLGWGLTSNGIADADHWQGVLGVNILDNLNLSANYGKLKGRSDVTINNSDRDYKAEELYGQLTYKMSKNLNTYLRYGTLEEKIAGQKDLDQDRGRLQVEYTF
ncbi:major outer membrane protein [Aliarcobacter butzleri]|uniref:major outer membrane protein n=1 Tax=Aliarcobacter butzleri TaxID=28197 RepID=UPI0021B4C07D|nr:major outer membrane protein [Aliarcobacter butzleri]MCT7626060.1 major outer membrane protein [Aliarcobacter butzleri]MCT7642787.1 major outer membrane protein [Aliarcobacter butzleri]